MIIKNVGPRYRGGVDIRTPDGWVTVPYGDSVEVDDEIGAQLAAEQPESYEFGSADDQKAAEAIYAQWREYQAALDAPPPAKKPAKKAAAKKGAD